jgi:hypothetical protein
VPIFDWNDTWNNKRQLSTIPHTINLKHIISNNLIIIPRYSCLQSVNEFLCNTYCHQITAALYATAWKRCRLTSRQQLPLMSKSQHDKSLQFPHQQSQSARVQLRDLQGHLSIITWYKRSSWVSSVSNWELFMDISQLLQDKHLFNDQVKVDLQFIISNGLWNIPFPWPLPPHTPNHAQNMNV